MKQLLILSGKGGTGKTTIASAFIKLLEAKLFADCDVDAPNLHLLIMQDSKPKTSDYYGMPKAHINQSLCIECDACKANCRFDAIDNKEGYTVDLFACEGCGVCEMVCSVGAISLTPAVAGELMLYTQENKLFSTAQLKMGSGTSGKLVTEVKKQMMSGSILAEVAILDGSPGIGCPVIASLSGVDMVLIVTEPSISGMSDMERIIKTAEIFQTKIVVCINKHDTNLKNSEKIKLFCKEKNISFAGEIPFDENVVEAINHGLNIIELDGKASNAIKKVYKETIKLLWEEGKGETL